MRVTSEVGRLRRVLCHPPGREVDGMIPDMMEELLFDDILHGESARNEHASLRRVLELLDVELFEAQELLAGALAQEGARDEAKSQLLHDARPEVLERVDAASDEELADLLVGGMRVASPHAALERDALYGIVPLPNYCFQRDPQVVVGSSVFVCAMSEPARARESLLSSLIMRYHPDVDAKVLFQPSELPPGAVLRTSIEGGDVMIISPDIVAVGQSERTNRAGIQLLADRMAGLEDGPRWLVVVEVPHRRAFMHLDTLFTPVDADACLAYPPVILKDGVLNPGVFLVDLHAKERAYVAKTDLLSTLSGLGTDLEPIKCGGDDPVAQQREQWTDGANAMALAPGVITVYDRNHRTADEMEKAGFRLVAAEDLLLGRTEVDLDEKQRTAILIPSNELSRARGGPHCLLHPLHRDDV